jgi:hypothetical protein
VSACRLCRACSGDGILFHFNPRSGDGVIVMNSLRHGHWEAEERIPLPPGKSKGPVCGSIDVEDDGFHVVLDSGRRYVFAHRLPLASFTDIGCSEGWAVVEQSDDKVGLRCARVTARV